MRSLESRTARLALTMVVAAGAACDREPASAGNAPATETAEIAGGVGSQESPAHEAPPTPPPTSPTLPPGAGRDEGRARAEAIATKTLTAWREGRFEPLSDAFSDQMRAALPPEAQQTAYASAKAMFGEFQRLEHYESVTVPQAPNMVVHRFKGVFSGAGPGPEVRVVLDQQSRVSGFWLKVWNPTLM